MVCRHCNSKDTLINVFGKCSDMSSISLNNSIVEGSIPKELGIGHGDYIQFNFCYICMRIQADPISSSTLKEVFPSDDLDED